MFFLFRTICSLPSGSHCKHLQNTNHPVQQHNSHPTRWVWHTNPTIVERMFPSYIAVIPAPRIENVARTGTIRAEIEFSVPPSERNADHFEVGIYSSSGPTNRDTDVLVSCCELHNNPDKSSPFHRNSRIPVLVFCQSVRQSIYTTTFLHQVWSLSR